MKSFPTRLSVLAALFLAVAFTVSAAAQTRPATAPILPDPSPTPIPVPPPTPVVLPFVSISIVGDDDAVAGGAAAKVIIRRVDGDTTNELVVRYKVTGAEAGVDYKLLPGSVILPAGVTQTKIKLKAIENANGTRTAKVKLLTSLDGSYIVGFPAVVKVKIVTGK